MSSPQALREYWAEKKRESRKRKAMVEAIENNNGNVPEPGKGDLDANKKEDDRGLESGAVGTPGELPAD